MGGVIEEITFYEDRIVCFLDILGFKNHIEDTVTGDGEDNSSEIKKLYEALNITGIISRMYQSIKWESTQFSDSIVISFPANDETFTKLLETIMWIQIEFILKGLICRGSITEGKLIHKPKLLFGPAFIDAYELESEKAKYPRIILSENMKTRIDNDKECLLAEDADGVSYINYIKHDAIVSNGYEVRLEEYYPKLHKMISDGLESTDQKVRAKYEWLMKKFNLEKRNQKESEHLGRNYSESLPYFE